MGTKKGYVQSPAHIAKRLAAFRRTAAEPRWRKKRSAATRKARRANPGWKAGRPENTPEVLWSKVDKRGPRDCWPWKGHIHGDGYGRTWIADKGYYAHRVIYNLAHPGQITLNAPRRRTAWGFLRHSCDNPPCCNPAHLIIGTQQENSDDKYTRGRMVHKSGEGSPRAKLTAEDVFWIRMHKRYGVTINALALLYDVSKATISGALYGRHYQDVS